MKKQHQFELLLWAAIAGFALALVLTASGCSGRSKLDLSPLVAAEASYSCMIYDDKPEDSEICQNCNGTGVVGDGVVERECPVCQGNKIQPESVLVHEEAQIILSDDEKVEQKGSVQCKTGNCPLR